VASFIGSISALAAGQVDAAAKRVEQTLASTLTVVIAFLAKFAGLGGIPDKLVGIVKKIRQPIDRALDKIVAWLGKMLDKLVAGVKATASSLLEWWKKKVPIAGETPHTLTFQGTKGSATLVVRSDPTEPVVFMTKAADKAKVSEPDRKGPIATSTGYVKKIKSWQDKLKTFDDNAAAAAAGKKATEADAAAKGLDGDLAGLATHIGATLVVWKVTDAVVKGLSISRGSFSVTQKTKIAEEAQRIDPNTKDLRLDSEGRKINVRKGIARRHVVSSHDMGQHYMAALNYKNLSEGKLLLEQRGSIAEALTPVREPATADAVKEAALARYNKFFGYAKNIFLGDSRENSSIQEHLDAGHPEMAGRKLGEHVARIKRMWAVDGSFQETPVRPE